MHSLESHFFLNCFYTTTRVHMRSFWFSIKTFFHKASRVIWKSADAFVKNDDYLKASALTYYTLISIVPFLAVAFGIATGFGFELYLEEELKNAFDEQQEVIDYAIKFARSLLQNAKGSLIIGVGLIALFWTNLSMLSNIESALNDIWRVKQPRSWPKKLTDYLAVMILAPIFVVISSSLSFYLITQITETAKSSPYLEFMSSTLLLLLKAAPFLLSALLFIMIYTFIPNVRINARPRIIAGILAGIAFQLWQWVYIKFQVEISNYGAIYGTFAALPLFLLWLQVSWLIVLGGAEMAAHIENEMSYTGTGSSEKFCTISKRQLGLLVLQRCVRAFSRGKPPVTAMQVAQDLGVPLMTIQHMLDVLEDSNILVEVVSHDSSRNGYFPGKDAELLTLMGVCDSIDQHTDWAVPIECNPTLEKIDQHLKELDQYATSSPANITFKQINIEVDA